MSIYQTTEEYLIGTFNPYCTDDSFSAEQARELHQKILALDPGYRDKTETKEEIRRAFGDFYINVAKVALFFKGTDQIIVKLIPYKTDPDEAKHITKISDYLASISQELGDVDREKNILLIPKKHVEQMDHFLKEVPVPVDKRKILRHAINATLNLDRKDSVFFMNGKVVIRFFKRAEAERRFEGLPPEEIKKIVDDIYDQEGEPNMAGDLDMIIATLSDSTLNFTEIDNLFFNTRHVKIIQEGLIRFYKTKISHDETVIKAAANYIFRESFYYIHELLAEKLLELIERKDKNTEAFLRYYNGNTFIQNGQKHTAPEIIDEAGQKWNIAAIVNFISQFSKNRTLITKKENTIRSSNMEEEELVSNITESTRLERAVTPQKTPTPDAHERIAVQLGKNRRMLDKGRANSSEQSINDLTPAELYEEFEKSIRDMHKRVDFLHMKTEGDQKSIDDIQEKFAEQKKKYDMLIIAISEVLMDRQTPAVIGDD